jgi:hypothetical protein
MRRRVADWWDYALLKAGRRRPPGDDREHAVHFYADEDGLLERMERWVVQGQVHGQRTVVFATPQRCAALAQRLRLWDLEGAVECHDAQAALDRFVVDGVPDPVLFDRVVGEAVRSYPRNRVRAYGEMVALLWQQGNIRGALDLEQLWNELQAGVQCPLLCAYAESDVGRHRDEVCAAHTHTV